MDQELLDYIRANRQRYTRAALFNELTSAGHAEEDVDEALDAVEREGGGGFVPPAGTGLDRRGRARIIVTAVAAAMFLGWTAWAALAVETDGYWPIAALILFVLLGIALLIGLALIQANRDLRAGAEGALVGGLVLPLLLLFGVFGSCLYTTLPR